MAMRRWAAAIIDLDGTMVNTLGDFEVALNLTLADLDLPPVPRTLVERTVGKGSEHLIRTVLAQQLIQVQAGVGHSEETLYKRAWLRYQYHYRRINGTYSVIYPGVFEGLQILQAMGCALACLTNKPQEFARDLLAAKGVSRYFSQILGGDSFERKKPDPLPLLKTCEALGVTPTETLMVGDSCNDGQAGHAAGCGVVLVTYGYNHGEPIRATPALAWIDSLSEISVLWDDC